MNVRRGGVVALRVIRQRIRDRSSLALLVAQPLLIMAIFGYAFSGDVTDVRVGVANLDRGGLGAEVLDRLDPEIVARIQYTTEAQVEAALRGGDVRAGIVVPANFTRNIEAQADPSADAASLILFLDNTNPQVTGAVMEKLGDAIEDALRARYDVEPRFQMDERAIFGPSDEADSLEFTLPGVIGWTVFMLGTMLTSVTIVKERTQGTLERMLATPVLRSEIVTGYVAAFSILAIFQSVVVLWVTSLAFRIPIRGSFTAALLVAALVGVTALGIGLLLSGVSTNEFQAVQSVIIVAFPSMFLSGVFIPVEAMPTVLRPLGQLLPLTYAVDALRGIISQGTGLAEEAWNIVVLAAFALGFVLLGATAFGRRRRS